MIKITDIRVYPVKSLGGYSLSTSELRNSGLRHDRGRMVTDGDYRFLTQRQLPAMATIATAVNKGVLTLSHQNTPPLVLTHSDARPAIETKIWKDTCMGIDEGDAVSEWLTGILGTWKDKPLRLVRFVEAVKRPVPPKYLNGQSAHTMFADQFPFLIVSKASVKNLNFVLERAGHSTVTDWHFRPNIVVDGLEAWRENDIDSLADAGNTYRLSLCRPCRRCKIVTVDPSTGSVSATNEPLKTLIGLNPFPHLFGGFFGQNAVLENGDAVQISVGDRLTAIP